MRALGGDSERVATRLYDRVGSRIVVVAGLGGFLVAAVSIAICLAAGFRFLNLSLDKLVSTVELWTPILVGLGTIGLLLSAGQIRTILAWSGEGRDQAAAARTWHAIVNVREVVTRRFLVGGLAIIPASAYVTLTFDQPWWTGLTFAFLGFVAGAALWVVVVSLTELCLRPMLEDVASHLPPCFSPDGTGIGLGTRSLAPVPAITVITVVVTGAYMDLVPRGALRLTAAVGVGLVAVVVVTTIFLMVSRSTLAPIGDLTKALQRVGKGDLTARVPLLSNDELGLLTHSFNQMASDLLARTLEVESSRQEVQQHADALRNSRERLISAADAERRRIERDLHDGAQQQLVLARLKVGLIARYLGASPGRAAPLLDELADDLAHALAQLRNLARGLHPPLLTSDGLAAALQDACRNAALPVGLEFGRVHRYPAEVETACYYCVLEALQNAAKHGGPGTGATVRLDFGGRYLAFTVSDDGAGFDPTESIRGLGIQNMIDRVGALGGEVEILSVPGEGTTISGRIELDEVRVRDEAPAPDIVPAPTVGCELERSPHAHRVLPTA